MPVCRVCRREEAHLSYEHVPPRSAFNDEPATVYGLQDWLERQQRGGLRGGRVQRRGAGGHVLCERCNNLTGSWYAGELARAARAGARILLETPLQEFDELTEYRWAQVRILRTETTPHPLRLIKQIITMILATSPPELTQNEPELGDFVLDRDRTGLSNRFHFYLALFAGPHARSTGVVGAMDFDRGRQFTLVEVAFPPFAYVMTIDSDPDPIRSVDITELTTIGYGQRADLELDLLIGFGHTAWPIDYRTRAMIEQERALADSHLP